MAKACVIFRGWDARVQTLLGTKFHGKDIEGAKDFPFAPGIQRLLRDAFEGYTQKNESDIAVFGVVTGLRGQRHLKSLGQQVVSTSHRFKQLYIRGQPGRMSQQHAESDLRPSRITAGKFRQDFHNSPLQVKSALV